MDIKQVVSGLRIAQDDLYRLATDGKDNFEIEAIKTAIYTMHELKEYKQLGALEEVREAVQELQLYKDGKICLVPEDVYARQCEELDAYKQLGALEELRTAVEKYSGIIICEECEYRTHVKGTDLHCCRRGDSIVGYLRPGEGCSRGEKRKGDAG